MTLPRIVLDTNVLVSALLFSAGRLAWLRRAWQAERLQPLASPETIKELLRVLTYPKFRLTPEDHEQILCEYLPWCETVVVADYFDVPTCRDPYDHPFLALALYTRADALVTGDKDLLVMAGTVPVPILTPAEFQQHPFPDR